MSNVKISCSIAIAIFSFSLLMTPARAQSPRVFRDDVQPQWFDGNSKFWYRIRLAENQTEFVLVDTVAGTRKPAFDHQRVAAAIGEATSTKLAPGKLPVQSLEFAHDLSSVLLQGRNGSWRLNLKSNTVAPIEQHSADTGTAFFLPVRKSVDRGGDLELKITNELDSPVQLIWIDRNGRPVGYGSIASRGMRAQHTFVGHVWLLQNAKGAPLAAFEATANAVEIILNKESLAAVKKSSSPAEPKRRRRRGRPSAAISPDGRWKAFVREDNLWLTETPSATPSAEGNESADTERQLTTDATPGDSFSKDASRARLVQMAYELANPPAETPDVHWSPTADHVLAFQTDRVTERRVHYVESSPADQLDPKLNSYPYAKPGDKLPTPRPRLFHVETGEEIAVATDLFPNPFELKFLKWSDSGDRFWLLYNERGHQNLRVLEVLADDGTVRAIVDEHSDTFIHYSTAGKFVLEWLDDGNLLWASERSGWNHLYRYSVSTGDVANTVTSGNWNVRRIEKIDQDAGVVWFYAVGAVADQDPYHEHFCKVHLDGSGFTVLTEGDGTHEVKFSPDRTYFLDKYSRVDLPPVAELRRSDDGSLVTKLETADASQVIAARGSLPIRFTAKGRDGKTDIWGIIHRPVEFNEDQAYPIVENIYAGPHDHHVPKAFRSSYRHQHEIADRGIVVVQIDGMGTAWRSKKFHDVCFQNLKDAGLPDRIAWMKAAAKKFTWIDAGRVGIYGGSAGGQNAMAALLWHGNFYKAAVADCGCHDNRMDKLWWNEQWMGWPVDDHYAVNSNSENASRLQGRLMLVVGELDRNVDPASTTQVVRQLIKANKDFDFLLMPGVGHGACERPYASRRRATFLAENLR
ncbi:prolyl oligopeptidase family serine peptidase [Fuerstiella marisgermanici]|uniref:Prolyl tripeptidyl peptidase n=1 Tax=Fuerstiella marisgermanici TaxID=1891926 RepID=A0A1P8WFA9_9PLAN|nr:prolyl oligopeptidase family serine peptidase [Fuerstiella marisgermanici]APZ92717.1 Prolyl tripeptidyl peptidase precursor [Fuerstiella marisgermanici]